ncbi:MAG: YiiD C-terminal domain-containing protein [Verrucomicrobiales bacterium]|nr:YiiD C-terminal domain-containing protein [Verrucomicrobiales bacterium]
MKIDTAELEEYLHEKIPVAKQMGIGVDTCQDGLVILRAPMHLNHNHLGTAFGGSLVTMATLAGYCALWVALGNRDAHIVVRRSRIEYDHPVTRDFKSVCRVPDSDAYRQFLENFEKRNKARMNLEVTISENDRECVRFDGEFVAFL